MPNVPSKLCQAYNVFFSSCGHRRAQCPGQAARELEALEAMAGAAPGGPREGGEELELWGALVGAEEDIIEEDVIEEDVIEAMESGVGNLNKSFKMPVSCHVSDGLAKAKECLAKAEAKLDDHEGSVSLGDVEDDVCWLYDKEIGVEATVHRTLKDNVAFSHQCD